MGKGSSRLGGAGRVWALNAALALCALVLYLGPVRHLPVLDAPFRLPWWIVAALFFLAEVFVAHVQFRRDAHSVSLGEVALVLGLFFGTPGGLLLGQLVGDSAALVLHRRQPPLKLAFNLSAFALETGVALLTFHAVVGRGDPIGPAGWAATGLAMLAASLIGVVTIFTAISLSDGRARFSMLPRMLVTGTAVTAANTCLALAGVTLLWRDPLAGWLLMVPAAMLIVAYRAYNSVRQRHESLEFLFEAIRSFHQAQQPERAIVDLLERSRKTFRAEVAEITFLPSGEDEAPTRTTLGPGERIRFMEPVDPAFTLDWPEVTDERRGVVIPPPSHGHRPASSLASRGLQDAIVAPLVGQGGVVGTILIGNHLGDVSTFGEGDLDLLEMLAKHLGVSLESARIGILQEAVEQLVETNRMKDDLIASASHELRTPLTAIQGFVKTLLRSDVDLQPDQRNRFLETVDRQSNRLRRLLEELATASRLESGRGVALVLTPVSVADVALEVLEELAPRARGHVFDLRIDVGLPAIQSDAVRVHQILSNLVENAIKYTPEGTKITVRGHRKHDGVLISVEDQGAGIPEPLHERIFDRYFQVDQSSPKAGGGVGLGLYICRRLADTLGARLWLERSDARGSIFSLWIPGEPPVLLEDLASSERSRG